MQKSKMAPEQTLVEKQDESKLDNKRYSENCLDPKEQFQMIMRARYKEKSELLTQLMKEKPPQELLECDEDTLREYLGKHRILPKKLRTDFVLERAFRKPENSSEDGSLISVFEKDFLKKEGDIHEYLYDGFTKEPLEDLFQEFIDEEREIFRQELILHVFIYYIIARGYLGMSRKIVIFESVKKIFKEIGSGKDNSVDENIVEEIKKKPEIHQTEVRVLGSPSYERLRRNLLHDMHVERRPISWFQKRIEYFKDKNKKKQPAPCPTSSSEPVLEEPKENKINKVMKEATKELLFLQRANFYEKYHNPDDILLEKLVILMNKMSNSMKQIENLDKKRLPLNTGLLSWAENSLGEEESKCIDMDWCFEDGSIEGEEMEQEGKVEVTVFPKEISFQIWSIVKDMLICAEKTECTDEFYLTTQNCLKKIMELTKLDRCKPSIAQILNEYKNVIKISHSKKEKDHIDLNERKEWYRGLSKDVMEMILGFEIFPEVYFEKISEKNRRRYIFQPYLGWDEIEELELMSHIENGKKLECVTKNFDTIWKKSDITGFCIFNNESQLMEEGKIIIRQQKEKRVKVMSGGRIGLEPLYSEYVSKGMLDCVVLGDKVDGPRIHTILQAIIHIASEDGVAIIIMNEIEYRFNFLLAAVKAKEMGLNVAVILARDDALDMTNDCQKIGRKGSAGIVLQFKVAAAMASEGQSLIAIKRVCQSMTIASISCYQYSNDFYIGNGFDKETGQKTSSRNFLSIEKEMLAVLMNSQRRNSFSPEPDTGIILLVNNQCINYEEICTVVMDISEYFKKYDVKLKRVYIGNFVALLGKGFTLAFAKDWNETLSKYLDSPTSCNLWPPHTSSGDFGTRKLKFTKKTILHGNSIDQKYLRIIEQVFQDFIKGVTTFTQEFSISMELTSQIMALVTNLKTKNLEILKPLQLLVAIGKEFENIDGFGQYLALLLYSGAQEFNSNKKGIKWRTWCEALFTGATALTCYTKYDHGDTALPDFLLNLARAVYKTEKGGNPLYVMSDTLDKLIGCKSLQKSLGVQFCSFVFNCLKNSIETNVSYLGSEVWTEQSGSEQLSSDYSEIVPPMPFEI